MVAVALGNPLRPQRDPRFASCRRRCGDSAVTFGDPGHAASIDGIVVPAEQLAYWKLGQPRHGLAIRRTIRSGGGFDDHPVVDCIPGEQQLRFSLIQGDAPGRVAG